MKVRFIKERRIYGVNSTGPFTRVFAVGDITDLPDMHARSFMASGAAVKHEAKATEPVKQPPAKKAAPRKRTK